MNKNYAFKVMNLEKQLQDEKRKRGSVAAVEISPAAPKRQY